jgi:hypothetical protein
MKCLLFSFGCVFSSALLTAASEPNTFTLNLAPEVGSEGVFLRYELIGRFGSSVQQIAPQSGVPTLQISTPVRGRTASRVRGLLRAAGCAIQTFDIPLAASGEASYRYPCISIPETTIRGSLSRLDRLYGRDVEIYAKYVAHWGESFVGDGSEIATDIPVGIAAAVSADGRFEVSVPDLARDPVAGVGGGEIHLWAREKGTGDLVARIDLRGSPEIRTRSGGLKIRDAYQEEMTFAPCAASPPQRFDGEGFAIRPDFADACGPSRPRDAEGFAIRQ